jgi:hypothetical protein
VKRVIGLAGDTVRGIDLRILNIPTKALPDYYQGTKAKDSGAHPGRSNMD